MHTLLPLVALVFALPVLVAFTILAMRYVRARLPPPDAPSARYAFLREQLRVTHSESVARTSALYRELERLRGRQFREEQGRPNHGQ